MTDEWYAYQERMGEHMWLEMKGCFRNPEPYPDDDWEDGYLEWLSIQDAEHPFSDDEFDAAAAWLAEHDPDR